MRILVLTPWYPDQTNPNHGIFVRDQAIALSQHHEVMVIVSKIDYTSFGVFSFTKSTPETNGVKEIHLTVKRSLPIFNQINFFLITIWQSLKVARAFSPDVIHGNIGYPGAFWSWWVSKKLRRPFIITEHTRITNNFRSYFHRLLTVKYLRMANAIISVSQHLADEIQRQVGVKPVVIPNIINVDKFSISPGPPASPVHIGFLGGMNTNVKGLDILLKAVAKIEKPYVLHIGGAGTLLEKYKVLASELGIGDRCIFYGFVPNTDVPAFMRKLHFLVSASRYETFGMVMVEAMACGLPVVAADSGSSADFINSANGILVPANNPEELRVAVVKMMDNYQAYNAEAIRKFVEVNYSARNFLDRIEKVYQSLPYNITHKS